MRWPSNLSILTNTAVDKVTLELHGREMKATGVNVVSANGDKSTYKARKEIISSAGAYCSPAILLRSGVGAKEEVERHEIKHQIDLPGVGRNLLDHLVSQLLFRASADLQLLFLLAGTCIVHC